MKNDEKHKQQKVMLQKLVTEAIMLRNTCLAGAENTRDKAEQTVLRKSAAEFHEFIQKYQNFKVPTHDADQLKMAADLSLFIRRWNAMRARNQFK